MLYAKDLFKKIKAAFEWLFIDPSDATNSLEKFIEYHKPSSPEEVEHYIRQYDEMRRETSWLVSRGEYAAARMTKQLYL